MLTLFVFGAGLFFIGSGVLWILWSVLEIVRLILFGTGPRCDD